MHCAVINKIACSHKQEAFLKNQPLENVCFCACCYLLYQSAKFSASADSNKENATITLISPVPLVWITVIWVSHKQTYANPLFK